MSGRPDLRFEAARDGSSTCRIGGLWLHSAYAPRKEAERFAATLPDRAILVIFGPCLDHLGAALAEARPGTRLIELQPDAGFRGRELREGPPRRYPGDPEGAADFLERALGEADSRDLGYVEWPAAAAAFPEAALEAREALKLVLERRSASAATIRSFGRGWILNAFRSFLLIEEIAAPLPSPAPWVVAAAGPSLDEAAAELARERSGLGILAVSSALSCLLGRGVQPDLVVASDGGYWSRLHLEALAARPRMPLALPLAALPSASLFRGRPLLLIDQGCFPENELCAFLGGAPRIPSQGTVSATAIRLAAGLGADPLLLAGLDLAAFDLRSHASGHAFEAQLDAGAGRTSPLEGLRFSREAEQAPILLDRRPWRTSRALMAYASAIQGLLPKDPSGRAAAFRLRPSPVPIPGALEPPMGGLRAAIAGSPAFSGLRTEPRPLPNRRVREDFLAALMDGLRAEAEAELRAFVPRPGAWEAVDPRLRDFLEAVDYPDTAALRRASESGCGRAESGACAESALAAVRGFLDRTKVRLFG